MKQNHAGRVVGQLEVMARIGFAGITYGLPVIRQQTTLASAESSTFLAERRKRQENERC